jgi:hypothetical protein
LLITNGCLFLSGQIQDLEIQDVTDERPMKKRHVTFHDEDNMELVQHRITSVKERVENVATEARDINSVLKELLHET